MLYKYEGVGEGLANVAHRISMSVAAKNSPDLPLPPGVGLSHFCPCVDGVLTFDWLIYYFTFVIGLFGFFFTLVTIVDFCLCVCFNYTVRARYLGLPGNPYCVLRRIYGQGFSVYHGGH